MADRQDRWQTGGRGTPRLILLITRHRFFLRLVDIVSRRGPKMGGEHQRKRQTGIRPNLQTIIIIIIGPILFSIGPNAILAFPREHQGVLNPI